eukprot:366441-Chlamydomonas_euryale.AAC.2
MMRERSVGFVNAFICYVPHLFVDPLVVPTRALPHNVGLQDHHELWHAHVDIGAQAVHPAARAVAARARPHGRRNELI